MLNAVLLFYKTHPPSQPLLAKNKAQKHAFCPFSGLTHFIFTSILSKNVYFAPFCLSICSPIHKNSSPQKQLLAGKKPLFGGVLAFEKRRFRTL